eukprot:8059977-Pyramimonas_sp.AAC.1
MVNDARLCIHIPGIGKITNLPEHRQLAATRRSVSTPANHKKPASEPFCSEFAKRNTCNRGDKCNFPH